MQRDLVDRHAGSDAAGGGPDAGDACGCPAPRTRRAGRPLLWIATLTVAVFAAYPYIASATAETEKRGDVVQTAASQTAALHVDGMTCESCVSHIVEALSEQPGVVKATVSFDDESASVRRRRAAAQARRPAR